MITLKSKTFDFTFEGYSSLWLFILYLLGAYLGRFHINKFLFFFDLFNILFHHFRIYIFCRIKNFYGVFISYNHYAGIIFNIFFFKYENKKHISTKSD